MIVNVYPIAAHFLYSMSISNGQNCPGLDNPNGITVEGVLTPCQNIYPGVCYQDDARQECCNFCDAINSTVTDCEFGDANPKCRREDEFCKLNKKHCCESCCIDKPDVTTRGQTLSCKEAISKFGGGICIDPHVKESCCDTCFPAIPITAKATTTTLKPTPKTTTPDDSTGKSDSGPKELEQTGFNETCIKFRWNDAPGVLVEFIIYSTEPASDDFINISRTTYDVSQFEVCQLKDHKRYLIEKILPDISEKPEASAFMYTRFLTPPLPIFDIDSVSALTITISIHKLDIDKHKNPFKRFLIYREYLGPRLIGVSLSEKVNRHRRQGENSSEPEITLLKADLEPKTFKNRKHEPNPEAVLVGVVKKNKEQTFVIGRHLAYRKHVQWNMNRALNESSEYRITVAAVNQVANVDKISYYSKKASTDQPRLKWVLLQLCVLFALVILITLALIKYCRDRNKKENEPEKRLEIETSKTSHKSTNNQEPENGTDAIGYS